MYVCMRVCMLKKTEAVFTKTDMYNELNINFLQNSLLGIQFTYTSEFFIGQINSSFEMMQSCTVLFLLMFSISLNLILDINIQLPVV